MFEEFTQAKPHVEKLLGGRPYKRLGIWKPENCRLPLVAIQLQGYCAGKYGLVFHDFDVSFRPSGYRPADTSRIWQWHHDCGGRSYAILVWADANPTEIMVLDTGKIYVPKPFALTLIDNVKCVHRIPKNAGDSRNFARIAFTP